MLFYANNETPYRVAMYTLNVHGAFGSRANREIDGAIARGERVEIPYSNITNIKAQAHRVRLIEEFDLLGTLARQLKAKAAQQDRLNPRKRQPSQSQLRPINYTYTGEDGATFTVQRVRCNFAPGVTL